MSDLSYGFVYVPSSKFRLTEFGWGFFIETKIEHSKFPKDSFDLPVSLDEKGFVSRVHLWRAEAKSVNLLIDKVPADSVTGILRVPVQYSEGGGAYYVGSSVPVRSFQSKTLVRNTFADHEENDNVGFF
jgi:hypothetical protein